MIRVLLIAILSECTGIRAKIDYCEEGRKACVRGFDPDGRSVIVKDTNGRLGNAIFTYQILSALRMSYGYDVYLGGKAYGLLHRYFSNITIPSAEDTLCGFEEEYGKVKDHIYRVKMNKLEKYVLKKTGVQPPRQEDGRIVITKEFMARTGLNVDEFIHSEEFSRTQDIPLNSENFPWQIWDVLPLTELKNEEYRKGNSLILYPGNFRSSEEDFKIVLSVPGIEKQLSEDLTLHSNFTESAERTLNSIFHKFVKSKKKRKAFKINEVAFVGIHNRRTDHLSYEATAGYKPLKPSYFIEAMELYRQRFGEKVLFIYVSDDPSWGITNIKPRNKNKDLFFVENGDPGNLKSVGHDLAIMASCNHSILSHGTFSYWAGFLADGRVILPDHFQRFRSNGIERDARIFDEHPLENPLPRMYYYV